MEQFFLDKIYNYYPYGLSSSDPLYYNTPENKRLTEKLESFDNKWIAFFNELLKNFSAEYVRDRSDEEPSHRCVIFIHMGDFLFELVLYVSRLCELYTFYCKKHQVDSSKLRTTEIEKRVNKCFKEIKAECDFMFMQLDKYFDYDLADENWYHTLIPTIATRNKDLGQATIFNAFFSDTEL